jgi:nitrite reductase (NADH) large subunit
VKRLVIIGNGMVGHRVIELMLDGGHQQEWNITVFCEEPRAAYDRVHLTSAFAGTSEAELALAAPGRYDEGGVELLIGDRAAAIDRAARTVTSAAGRVVAYDQLILATGSAPFVPPIPGRDAAGCFVYRTLDDVAAIRDWAGGARRAAVIGGGLLGLEAADALRRMELEVHVVELAPRLMALQLDEVGGALLRSQVEGLGLHVHTGKSTAAIAVGSDGRVAGVRFADGDALDVDMVVFSAGIRPRDELARKSGLGVGERGGIVVDEQCRTSDDAIFAVGECALPGGRLYGLVAPGYHMAKVAVDALTGDGRERFTAFDMSTKLKLLGVDVASFGDPFTGAATAPVLSWFDAVAGTYKKLVLTPDKRHIQGGILVGDASAYGQLLQLQQNQMPLPPDLQDLLVPPRAGGKSSGLGVGALPDSANICSCLNVTKGAICSSIRDQQLTTVAAVKKCTKAGTGCGSCTTLVGELLKGELARAGVTVSNHLCEHFAHSRQELFHLVRLHAIKSFDDLIARHGRGRGCEICKPAVASMLASTWNEHVLDKRHLPLQDTNDRFLANIQRDGTYSVVPRVPGGEITPEKLIAIGQVAQRFGLYTKITGGQRIDLFGARVEQLPEIWRQLIAAGFESGHAYGKALRTVKSCVGSTWCRFGVQDSVSFAIAVENRYKGLRSPHKLKSAVSGCARECAEAQSKDFGIIATEKGYNLYLCGNGGMKPQHAQLFATDLDEATVIRYLDRFLMFYIRTADRLQRTASWLNALDGGIDYLKRVLIDDSLGICAELEADMERVVGSYQCEWKATLADGDKLRRFRPFVNSTASDPSVVFLSERGQPRPATWDEKTALSQKTALSEKAS